MKKSKLLSVVLMSAMLAMTACGNKEVQETFESETLIESETIIESDTETSDNMEVETDVVESDVEIKAETKEETKAETIKTASANTSTTTTDKTTTNKNNNSNSSSNTSSSSTGNTTNTNKNNNNSSNNSSSNSNTNNSSSNSSNNSNSNSNKVETETSAPTPAHTHNWVAQYKTVHHDATGHYETVTIQESKPIYSSVQVCSVCGAEFATADEIINHVSFYCMGGYYSKAFIAGYTDPITESKWVQDKAAYDEQVLTGYKCSGCSATK